jgi:hypothetical protein
MIHVRIENAKRGRKLNYHTWAGAPISFERDYGTLRDDLGNSYKRIDFGFGTTPSGRIESESLYPGNPLSDVLVIETPIEGAKHLDLELPAKNVGGDGVFKIRIPFDMK